MSSEFGEDDFPDRVPLSQRAMARPHAPWLDELNPAQLEAVKALEGPVLMLAGAGTGKTKALTSRIAELLATGTARPNEVLAVTFTNKAAREMKTRVGRLLGEAVEGMPWLGTFHSISAKLLRRHAELVGLKTNFTILDTDDQVRLLKQLIVAEGIDEKRWPARQLAHLIDGWKNRALTPEKVPTSDHGAFNHRGVEIYAAYQARLKTLNAVDFGDLLLHMVTIFQTHEDVLAQYRRWFRYILVDEYQDTNVAQYLWLRLLADEHRNICCVGDDDQSIYGWRGAEVGNILRFEKDFPGAKVVRLEQNYRSTPHILGAASGVISANADRLGKTLFTDLTEGEKVRLIGHWDGDEEARWIGEEIEAVQRGTRGMAPKSLNDIAILVRASHQMRAFEDRFLTIGMPYRVIGGPRFYERREIRDAMAYFRLAVSPEDDLAFERVFNVPKRGLGDKASQTLQRTARAHGVSMVEASRIVLEEKGLGGKGAAELTKFIAAIDRWHWFVKEQGNESEIKWRRSQAAQFRKEAEVVEAEILEEHQVSKIEDLMLDESDEGFARIVELLDECRVLRGRASFVKMEADILSGEHDKFAGMILDESGYTEMWQNDKTPEAPGRLENLKELVNQLDQFENLQGFLEHVSLVMDNDTSESEEKVSIMTLHAAKGLEFPVVFLPGWEDGLFPSQRSMDESGLKGLEEERRLAYVGITRAEEVATISFASNRRVFGQWQSQMASRFIDELPEEHVEVLHSSGLNGSGYGMAFNASPAMQAAAESDLADRVARADGYNSPGWKRLQERQARRGMAQPSEARNMVIDLDAVSSHTVGERVFHQKFGYGVITGIEGDKLDIAFEKAGEKKVVAKFVTSASSAGNDVPF